MKRKIVVLSGAGISAESGVSTFRGAGGLWEGYDVREVATPEAWDRDPQLVLSFYNARRKKIREVEPNAAHTVLAQMEETFDVNIVTQNIDDLHERAGSKQVLHLHGKITQACSSIDKECIEEIGYRNIEMGQYAADGSQLRPFIVWFGEDVPQIHRAASMVSAADILLVIGTSMEVYPAASLMRYCKTDCTVYVIDPADHRHKISGVGPVNYIQKKAVEGIIEFRNSVHKKSQH